jgi:hypothetical protein
VDYPQSGGELYSIALVAAGREAAGDLRADLEELQAIDLPRGYGRD